MLYREDGAGDPDLDCGTCLGYGGDTAREDQYWEAHEREKASDGEFEVNQGGAALILRDILGLGPEEAGSEGELPIWRAEMRLAVFTNPEGLTRDGEDGRAVVITEDGVREGCRVIEGPVTLESVQRRLGLLRTLVGVAVERGADRIVWY